ncbi:MAG: hypothetical protein J6W23_09480 [Victivallales bacterium]|nr:hypothetical protein [Victivallales bacterium]
MPINLDTIRWLNANKTYYLSNSTGEIKEAGGWQKFKCFFGVGDGREKAAKLVNAVKSALLEASDKITDTNLDTSIRNFNNSRSHFFSISGHAIAELAANFNAANQADIARIQAGQIAKRPLNMALKDVRSLLRLETGSCDDVREVLKRAAKPLIDHPPMKTDATGRQVIDEDAFKEQLDKVLADAVQTIFDVSKAGPTGRTRFDAAVRDAMFATLYGPDGKRNKKEVSAMKLFADSRFNKVMANAITIRPQGVPEDVFAARVRTLVDECGEDPDMLDAVECNARRFLVTGDSKLRTPEDIAKRVTAYKSTLREMLAVAENNPAMRAAVKEMSSGLAGVVLPKGLCAKVIEEAMAVDLAPFENIDETSIEITIHNAVMALNKAVNNVIKNVGAIDALYGADEHQSFFAFVECAIISRLPKASLRGISAALATPIAAKLTQAYRAIGSEKLKLPKNNLPRGVNEEVKEQFRVLGSFIDQLKAYAERALGRENVTLINIEDAKKVPEDDFYFGNILESVQNESAEVVAEKRKVFLNTRVVKGQGEAAEMIRGFFSDMIGPAPFDPADVAFNKITRNASKMTNRNIMRIAKMVMEGNLKDTILFKDVDRRMEVTLEGVGTLDTDFNKALDQIARFVTGKKDAKFETLDDVSKKKAAIVIGFLGQESDKAIVEGCAYALDSKGDTAAIIFGGRQNNDKKVYNLRLGKDGHLYMNLQLVEHREYLANKAGKMVRPKGGITIKAGIDYNIAPKEMNRLIELDLASYDDSGANEELLAVGEKVMNENRIDKMYDKIPEDYKITARCVTYYDVDVQD